MVAPIYIPTNSVGRFQKEWILSFKCYLLTLFVACWVFIALFRLPLVVESGGYSLVALCRLITAASLVAEHRSEGV